MVLGAPRLEAGKIRITKPAVVTAEAEYFQEQVETCYIQVLPGNFSS